MIAGVSVRRYILFALTRIETHEFPKGSHITLQGKVSPLGMNVEDAVPHW